MRRLTLLVIAVFLACAPSTVAPAAAPSPTGPNVDRAVAVVEDLAARRYDAVIERFDATMRAALSRDRLAGVWEDVVRQYGAYTGHSRVVAGTSGGFDVVVVTAELERGAVDVQVAFDRGGLVAGLFVRPGTSARNATPAAPQDRTLPALLHAGAIGLALAIAAVFVFVIQRRTGIAWRIVALGGLTFVLSQVLHIPFNAIVLTPLIGGQALVVTAIALGLSAGLFEELTRWVVLRTLARDARTWQAGLAFGVGHGAIEVVVIATLVGAALLAAIASPLGAADLYWSSPAALAFALPYERALALVLHLSLAVLVVRAVARQDPRFLALAIAWHATVDAVAVYVATVAGAVASEALLTVLTAGSVAIVLALRPAPQPAATTA